MLSEHDIRQRELAYTPKRRYQQLEEIADIVPPGEGIKTGWHKVDNLILGLQPNRMNEFVGYTSHGKTAGMISVVNHNLDNDLLTIYVSGDDSPESLLWKFIAFRLSMRLEDVMRQDTTWRHHMIRDHFAKRLIIATDDKAFSADTLAALIDQIQEDMNRQADIVCFDYLGTLDESKEGNSITQGALAFKKVVRTFPDTTFILGHQCNRGAVTGAAKGLETYHVEYGGVKECDGVMIGFRRRIDTEELSDEDLQHESLVPTVNLSVMKNKVTGNRSAIEGYRMAIDPVSGLVRELSQQEQYYNVRSIQEVRLKRSEFKERRAEEASRD